MYLSVLQVDCVDIRGAMEVIRRIKIKHHVKLKYFVLDGINKKSHSPLFSN